MILVLSVATDFYPPTEQLVEQCGKFRLLDRLVTLLLARKHKVWFCSVLFVFVDFNKL